MISKQQLFGRKSVSLPQLNTNNGNDLPHRYQNMPSTPGKSSAQRPDSSSLRRTGSSENNKALSQSAQVIANQKADYAKTKQICEYVQFYTEVRNGSILFEQVEKLFQHPVVVGDQGDPYVNKLMDSFERLFKLNQVDVLRWFDGIINRPDHALRHMMPFSEFSAELIMLAVTSRQPLWDDQDARTVFLYMTGGDSVDTHLTHNKLQVAVNKHRLSPSNAKRMNNIAQIMRNITFVLTGTKSTMSDFRKKNNRPPEELKRIGVVELETMLQAIFMQYSSVFNGEAPTEATIVPNGRGSFMILNADSTAAASTMSSTSHGHSRKDGFGTHSKDHIASHHDQESVSLDGNQEAEKKAEEEPDVPGQDMINEDVAQFFDSEERRLLHNLVKHFSEGEGGNDKLPAVNLRQSFRGVTYERRSSILRKSQIQSNIKSFHAMLEAQEATKRPEPVAMESTGFTLFGEIIPNTTPKPTKRKNNLSMEEIIQKNLNNLTGKSHTHAEHASRPKTGGYIAPVNPLVPLSPGATLPNHEKVIHSFDSRVAFATATLHRR